MISLAQTALMGIAGYVVGNLVTKGGAGGETKGLILGWDPTLALVLAIVITTVIGLILGAVGSRSFGIYFLMLTLTFGVIANYFFGQVTKLGGFSPIAGINQYTPRFGSETIVGHPDKLYYIALGVSVVVYVVMRYLVRTPFGLSLQGQRDEPVRARVAGLRRSAPPNGRLRLRGIRRIARRRALRLVGRPDLPAESRPRRDDRPADHRRDRRARAGSKAHGSAPSRSS